MGIACAVAGVAVAGCCVGVMADLTFASDTMHRQTLIDAAPDVLVGSQPIQARSPRSLLTVGDRTVLEIVKNIPPSTRSELKPYTQIESRLEGIDPGVRAVAPRVALPGVYRNGSRYRAVGVLGILPGRETKIGHPGMQMTEGSLDALDRTPTGTVIGAELARWLKVGTGGRVSFITTTGTVRQLVVVGIFRSDVDNIDRSRAYIPLVAAQNIRGLGRNAVTGIGLTIADAAKARKVRDRVENTIGYQAETWEEANRSRLSFQSNERLLMWIVLALALVVSTLGVRNAVLSKLLAKRLGQTEGTTLEDPASLTTGLVAGTIGALLACGLLYGLGLSSGLMDPLPLYYDPARGRIDKVLIVPGLPSFAIAAAISVSTGVVGGLMASRSVPPGRAPQVERAEVPE